MPADFTGDGQSSCCGYAESIIDAGILDGD